MPTDEATGKSQQQSVQQLSVGGSKGHEVELISGNVLILYNKLRWKMIPNCTGRYTCRDHKLVSDMPPLELLKKHLEISDGHGVSSAAGTDKAAPMKTLQLQQFDFILPGRPDRLLVVPLDDCNRTGLITYVKEHYGSDREQQPVLSYVHTLNTPSGFRRKLQAVGLQIDDGGIWFLEARDK